MKRRQGLIEEREDGIWFKYIDIVLYSCVYLFKKHLLCTYYILSVMSALEGRNTKLDFDSSVSHMLVAVQ